MFQTGLGLRHLRQRSQLNTYSLIHMAVQENGMDVDLSTFMIVFGACTVLALVFFFCMTISLICVSCCKVCGYFTHPAPDQPSTFEIAVSRSIITLHVRVPCLRTDWNLGAKRVAFYDAGRSGMSATMSVVVCVGC